MKHTYWGLLLASVLLFISFLWQPIDFWIVFPLSLALLTVYALFCTDTPLFQAAKKGWIVAPVSGIMIYLLFAIGKEFLIITGIPLLSSLEQLYQLVQPKEWYHYIWLFFIIIPGEEFFWRYFMLNQWLHKFSVTKAILIATLCYGIVHLLSGSLLLVLAALIAGLVWNYLYYRTKNIWAVIVCHQVFNLFLLVLFPLF
ncbi:CAAX amino terminal protease [Alkalihalobacillus alcalophilus ATCC 27647 = CGMCC 1.3604]|uniref:CAAX amino terminal protease n=1 Tax=Alkalihalobacillus alcalophilus ATCC 27647 = CGMCC 1.3604 TaxID=1218173 RepID=A0A4S4JUN4_ALKAL|nr:CAAX amino terminal protease [Alkalihalobacillus alcalophilus ATCC 27647 = CGMCC 1.3604]